jgi:putative membrane protein
MMNEFGGHGWGMGWWWIIGIIVIVAIVWVVVATMRSSSINQTSSKSPLDVLKERYARGEIGKEEFDEKKGTLDS